MIENTWTEIISPKTHWFDLKIKEVWRYRDLIMLFVRRDFVATYKQTIFGIGWYFIEPFITTVLFTLVFSGIAHISTNEVPPLLFYMCGVIAWNYFAKILRNNSTIFTTNAQVFGKVYFPRLSVPISNTISGLVAFGFQLLLFLGFYLYYLAVGANIQASIYLLFVPVLLLIMAALGLGLGIMISALTVRYRDLAIFINFGVQLLMYLTPVIYPASEVPVRYQTLVMLNPIASVLEGFRYAFLGKGTFDIFWLSYAALSSVLVLFIGIVLFNKVEKNFMDTV